MGAESDERGGEEEMWTGNNRGAVKREDIKMVGTRTENEGRTKSEGHVMGKNGSSNIGDTWKRREWKRSGGRQ